MGFIINPYNFGTAPTYSDTFSAIGSWVEQDSTYIGISGGVLNFNNQHDGTNDATSFDLMGTTISDTKWTLRFKLTWSTITIGNNIFTGLAFGISSLPSSSAYSASHDFIGMTKTGQSSSTQYFVYGKDGTGLSTGEGTVFTRAPQVETVYVEIKRISSTSASMELFSNSSYTTSLEYNTVTVSATTTNLRYIWIGNRDFSNAATSVTIGSIDDLQFWNNV